MSGDVQPRKRKDKKKKKDELGLEEPRGTAAALGEGDVFIHSHHEHGTGGHWCAKIIFFSLLAVLITLVGLIILENRGLTELEANSVESKYSGVLEGWIEDAPEDDHYDEHTLDLKHPEDEDEDHPVEESNHDEDDEDNETANEHEEEEEDDEHSQDEDNESNEIDEDDDNDEISEENVGETEEVEERIPYRRYNYEEKYNAYDDDDDDDDDDHDEDDDESDNASEEVDEKNDNLSDDEENASNERDDDDDDDDDNDGVDHDEDDDDVNDNDDSDDVEQENDDEKDNIDEGDNEENDQAHSDENDIEENFVEEDGEDDEDDEIEKIEAEKSDEIEIQEASKEDDDDYNDALQGEDDDDDEPPVEQITTPPAGKPFVEVEEETTVKPVDTLAEEVEYERRQEELRKEKEEQGSQMWLKLAVGGALLVATHAVLRRATARDAPEPEERSREETPSIADRRMTLIPDEPVVQPSPISAARSIVDEEVFKRPAPVFKNEPLIKPNIVEEVSQKKVSVEESKPIEKVQQFEPDDDEEKELYSDEEEVIEEEEEEEENIEPPKVTPQPKAQPVNKEEPEDSEPEEVPEDVEIIDDEQIEEDVEEEEEEDEDEEEISDVDDAELLSRLEAKYGRLPEPERPGRQKDGGNSIEDEWPGEPLEPYWREQLDIAEDELRQGALASCERRLSAAKLTDSARARWILAQAIDANAEAKRDNKLLSKAISAYLNVLKMNERLSDGKLLEVARRTIDRIQFRGIYLNAEPVYRLLIRRFPQEVNYRNNLTISFLMANRADLAAEVLRETLRLWPNDRVALAHHGFVLKNQFNKLEEAVDALTKALEGDTGPANEPRFYYHLGDALLLLGRHKEANEVHIRGAKLGHFLSPAQRSLYNVPRLRSRPWWKIEETPYVKLARALEKSWREILKEGEAAKELYEKEKEGLMEKGEWSQLDIFVRGREVPGRCARAPVTCAVVRAEAAAARCSRGQVKFSALAAGTHVRAHVGPTNCRLRMHLALTNTDGTYLRVDNEIRQWQVGKTFMFDDSFEHEVWHNGTATRLVLIVDVWHPDLTPQERRSLPAI